MRKVAIGPVLGAFLVLMALPVVPAGVGDASVTHVHMENTAFSPETVTILTGETVEWDNHDSIPHTVTEDNDLFDSGTMNNGDFFDYTFDEPGVYGYFCAFHSGMDGTVFVLDPTALPDLVVTAVEVAETVPGLFHEITVEVRNLGQSAAAPSAIDVGYRYNGDVVKVGEIEVPALTGGATHTDSVTWDTLGKLGDFELEIEADAAGDVPEANEGNNIALADASVLVSGVEGVDALEHVPDD